MRKLLVIEDGESPIRLMVWGLEQEGFAVVTAKPNQAASAVKGQDLACIILHLTGDVKTALQDIRLEAPSTTIIGVGDGPPPPGVDVHIPAPFTIENLVAAISVTCDD